jgi:acyl carrier protein phosphodiesterase
MLKVVTGVITAIFVAGSSFAYAQDSEHRRLSQSDLSALTDARIGVVKAALQLTPEQQKYWPAIEDAIRARAAARQARLAALPEQLSEAREGGNLVDVIRERANLMAQRAAALKQLADAWQPLEQTLDQDQKRRLRFLATRVLKLVKARVEHRRMEMQDEDDDED